MSSPTNLDATEQVRLAAEVFLYGYPLVYNMREMVKFPAGPNLLGPEPVPYNTFGFACRLLDPTTDFVSPNNDTLYIIAVCDVRGGPLVLQVPDTHDRYYVLQFVDAWTSNFAYIGRRGDGHCRGALSAGSARLSRRRAQYDARGACAVGSFCHRGAHCCKR